jgi:tetratricopeptide (TPR) repeat protein
MDNGNEAEKMLVRAMKVRKKILGREHEDTLNSMAMIGLAYHLRGRWDAAEELDVQVMETSKKKLGADYPSRLSSMANLVSTYWNQGRWDDAEELFVQVMETSKNKLEAEHSRSFLTPPCLFNYLRISAIKNTPLVHYLLYLRINNFFPSLNQNFATLGFVECFSEHDSMHVGISN